MLFLLTSTFAFSQENEDNMKSKIIYLEELIKVKLEKTEFLSKLIIELKTIDEQDSLIDLSKSIIEKEITYNLLEKEILELKVELLEIKVLFPVKPKLIFSERNELKVKEEQEKLENIKADVLKKYEEYFLNEESKKAFANSTIIYTATILNTKFSIPIARFNFKKNDVNKQGDILLFNSIGAGFGISGGRMLESRNSNGELVNTEFKNTLGFHLGILFSAGSGDGNANVFAPTATVSILDFQLGIGYELGSLNENQRPLFLTLGYAIPLYKLLNTQYWFLRRGPIMNEVMPF